MIERERSLPPFSVVLRRIVPIALLVGIACALLAYLLSSQRDDQYSATALLQLRPVGVDPALPSAGDQLAEGEGVATNVLLVSRPGVLGRVSERPGVALTPEQIDDGLEVEAVEGTNILRLNVTTTDPLQAARVVNAVGEEFVAIRRTAARSRTSDAREVLTDQLGVLSADDRQTEAGLRLREQIETLRVQEELGGQAPQVVEEAAPPLEPVSPQPRRDAALAGLFGLLLGGGLGLLRVGTDRRLGGSEDVREALDAPVVVTVPSWGELHRGRKHTRMPRRGAQGFRLLHLSLRGRNGAGPARTVAVTSTGDGEDADVAAWHLAAAASAARDSVLLVESPSLLDGGALSEAVRDVWIGGDSDAGFHLLPVTEEHTTSRNGNPLHTGEALREAAQAYDIVVVQTSDSIDDPETTELLRQVDGVVVTARQGRLERERADALRTRLELLGATLLAVVVDGD